MVDPERLRSLLDRLQTEVAQLRKIAETPGDRLLADPITLSAAKYGLVVAVEICIDVGQHVIASEGLRAPEDFADVFTSLAEGDFIPPGSVPTLREMAKFRNLLVHVYERVDDRRVVEILQGYLDDFDRFKAQIAKSALEG